MGFFDDEEKPRFETTLKGLSVDMLHKQGCAVCPLNIQTDVRNPHMEPTGSDKPDVYMLGQYPTALDDRKDQHFAGYLGDVIRLRIPPKWDSRMRWNHVVRTRTPNERAPSAVEMECCRPSIVKDIERTKPKAIFGFGDVTLDWAIKENRIDAWAGRRMPIKVGKHKCWFFPMMPPDKVADTRRFEPKDATKFGSDLEHKFAFDMRNALRVIDRLPEPIIHTREDAVRDVEIVTGREPGDLDKVLDFIDACYDEDVVGLDYETNCKRPFLKGAKILTAALSTPERTLAWAFRHRSHGWTEKQLVTMEKAWRRFLIKSKCRKVSHHLGFEGEWSVFFFGVDALLNETWECSMSQAYLLDERPNTHSLDVLCIQYYGLPIKDLFPLDKKDMESEKLETILLYNGVDAKYHRGLFFKQRKALKRQHLLAAYAHHIGRVKASVMTTRKGVPVNPDVVEDNFDAYEERLERVEKEIAAMTIAKDFKRMKGRDLRPSNNHDVVEALQKLAGLTLEKTVNKKRKREPTAGEVRYSTTEENMMKLEDPFAKAIIRWRKLNKLMGTYVIPVRKKDTVIDGKVHKTQLFPDGKMHPIVSTTKARTWRTTSEEPNIQNWPMRGPSKVIRKQITVDEDHVIVAVDYAGIQARNVAMESRDKGLIKHYWDRYDIHSDWLDKLLKKVPTWKPKTNFGKMDAKALRKEYRSVIKNKFVFPSFFGAVGKSIAGVGYLGIDERHAMDLSEEFFDEFPDVKGWHESCKEFYDEHGFVTGLSEFKRRAPIAINQLINAPIQADESIIVCGAWYRLCATRDERLVPNWMIHDDLTFIWKKKELDEMLEIAVPIILHQEHEWEKIVPMEIEIKVGQNWCDLKDLAKFETLKGGGFHQSEGEFDSSRWDYKVGNDGVPLTRQAGWVKHG